MVCLEQKKAGTFCLFCFFDIPCSLYSVLSIYTRFYLRNTLKYVPDKDKKAFAADLKSIYHASNEEQARTALDRVNDKWTSKYPNAMKCWYNNWDAISTIFKFSASVRKKLFILQTLSNL